MLGEICVFLPFFDLCPNSPLELLFKCRIAANESVNKQIESGQQSEGGNITMQLNVFLTHLHPPPWLGLAGKAMLQSRA